MEKVMEKPRIIVAEDGRTYTFNEVATYVKYHAPTATQREVEEFFNYCKLRNLSPYDVHFIKYGNGQPVIVVGKGAFLKRAERSKQLDGYKAGVITANKETKETTYRDGAFYVKDKEELIGGWAEVYRKDFSHPIRSEVSTDEYMRRKKNGELMDNWSKMPATMIRKVALVQALREAFPSEMSGMYVAEEMGVEADGEETKVIVKSDDEPKPITEAQRKKLIVEAQRVFGKENWREAAKNWMKTKFEKEHSSDLTREEASELIDTFTKMSDFDGKSLIGPTQPDPLFQETTKEGLFGGKNG